MAALALGVFEVVAAPESDGSVALAASGVRATAEPGLRPPTKPPLARFEAVPRPKIRGKARVGKKLTLRPGDWKPTRTSLKYQWLRNGKEIAGAVKVTYRLTRKDRGKRISARVTGWKPGYFTASRTSHTKRIR